MQIDVAAIVYRFSADLFCSRVVFFAFQSAVAIGCARLLFLNCGLVWLAAVLDGGGSVLVRVLYRDSRDAGCSYDAFCGPFGRAAGIRRSGSPGGRINSVFSFKVSACCTANMRGFVSRRW